MDILLITWMHCWVLALSGTGRLARGVTSGNVQAAKEGSQHGVEAEERSMSPMTFF